MLGAGNFLTSPDRYMCQSLPPEDASEVKNSIRSMYFRLLDLEKSATIIGPSTHGNLSFLSHPGEGRRLLVNDWDNWGSPPA